MNPPYQPNIEEFESIVAVMGKNGLVFAGTEVMGCLLLLVKVEIEPALIY
jgi:hypothetical protein